MQEHFFGEIDNLKASLIKMASLVDEQVERVIKALETGENDLCKGVKAKDLEVDAYDNLIQTQCENILALFQPVASDLRFVISALMTNNQLERCGDIAVNIARRVKKTSEHRELIVESEVVSMAIIAKFMLKDAIESFIKGDIELANKVLATDEEVDEMNKNLFKYYIKKMQENSEVIEPAAHLIVLVRQLERLADHATNIAESVIFSVEAKIVTHAKKLKDYKEKE